MARRLAILVVVLLFSGAACSAEPETLTLAEYFAGVEEATETYRRDISDAGTKFDSDVLEGLEDLQDDLDRTDPDQVAAYEGSVTRLVAEKTVVLFSDREAILGRFLGRLEGLLPPEEARAAHEELLRAALLAKNGIPPVRSGLQAVASTEDIRSVVAASPYADAQPRFLAACQGLLGVAAQNELVVALTCPL